jgi:hypothetical protein
MLINRFAYGFLPGWAARQTRIRSLLFSRSLSVVTRATSGFRRRQDC